MTIHERLALQSEQNHAAHRTTLMMQKMLAQPHFCLLAQDVTADLVVDLWTIINVKLADLMDKGVSPELALQHLRELFHAPHLVEGMFLSAKLRGAVRVSAAMRAHQPRKVAD